MQLILFILAGYKFQKKESVKLEKPLSGNKTVQVKAVQGFTRSPLMHCKGSLRDGKIPFLFHP